MPAAEWHPDGADQRAELLATKVHVPYPAPGLVSRPRLVRQLTTGVARGTVLVCGPAGYGKSSLLTDWVRTERSTVAWLSVDEGDNDPTRFWRHVALAMDTARAGVGERIETVLEPSPTAPVEAPATALVNAMADASDEFVLVVDDYHQIRESAVHRSVEFLLEHHPPSFRLVLATRADPPLPLARQRARGRLSELRAADLRFTNSEAAQLLRAGVGELPDTAVAALGERTEGWGAGLALAALSLQDRTDVEAFVEAFSGSHRFVLDYLTEEVLDRQPEPTRTFLLETSVLDGLSGPLCDAVRGRDDGQQQLEALERDNVFVHRLDDGRHWWRYHHLFADLLRARLRREHPDREPELHRAAADWYERNELPDEAIRHASAAGAHDRAARLIEQHMEERILRRNEAATLARWVAALPPAVVDHRPRLSLGQAVAALLAGRPDEAEQYLAQAERTCASGTDDQYEPSVGREASILANVATMTAICRADLARQRGDPELQRRFARQGMTHLAGGDTVLGAIARLHVAGPDWVDGRLTEAEQDLSEVVRVLTGSAGLATTGGHGRYTAVRAVYNLGGVQHAQGRLAAAARTYRRGIEASGGPPRPPLAGIAQVGLAAVLYDRDELDAAEKHATEGIALARRLTYTPPVVAGLITLARIRQARGDTAGAADTIGDAVDAQHTVVDLRNPVQAWQAQLAVAAGRVRDAARWLDRCRIGMADEPSYRGEREHMVLARVLLADGAGEQAAALLSRWQVLARDQDRTSSMIEIGVLLALAHQRCEDRPAALAALADALTLAAPEGHLRAFLDEGAPIATLVGELLVGRRLEQLAGDAVPAEFLDRLSRAFERFEAPVLPATRRGAVAVPGLVEPLTARELEVLALIADGSPNRDVAAELVITLDTVKRHVSHLLEKLAVANRTEAVGRARRLGLLP